MIICNYLFFLADGSTSAEVVTHKLWRGSAGHWCFKFYYQFSKQDIEITSGKIFVWKNKGVLFCTKWCEHKLFPVFVFSFHCLLQIIWKRKCSRPLSFYNMLINEHWDLIKDFEIRVIPKKFAANKVGEKIVIWETETKKTLYLQVIVFSFVHSCWKNITQL